MTEYFGKEYIPVEWDFFSGPSFEVAPRLIGCVIHHDNRGKDTAIMIVEVEAYDKKDNDKAIHGSAAQMLPHGHAYVHHYRRSKMWALDLVCSAEGDASSVLIRAGVPVVGMDTMIERREKAEQAIRNRTSGFEKRVCKGPCNVGEALAIYALLDGASLFKKPFRI